MDREAIAPALRELEALGFVTMRGLKAPDASSPKRLGRPGAPTILHTTADRPDRGIGQQNQGVAGTKAAKKRGALSLIVRDVSRVSREAVAAWPSIARPAAEPGHDLRSCPGDSDGPQVGRERVAADQREGVSSHERAEHNARAARLSADRVPRICAPHGLSNSERKLLTEAMHWLRDQGPGAFISIEAGRSPDAEPTVRALARRLRSDLVQRQRRAGMRWGLLVTVFEALGRDGWPKFNAHVIVVMPDADARDRLIESLHRSSVYSGRADVRPVDDWSRLTAYLLKDQTVSRHDRRPGDPTTGSRRAQSAGRTSHRADRGGGG
jgi:hypothetical protein